MDTRKEQVFVGIFVIIAAALMVATVFALTGVFAQSAHIYHAKFADGAGIVPGTTVRFAGSDKVGRVEKVKLDSADPTLLDMEISVKKDVPVKTDSHVKIMSYSPLGDNHVEIKQGSAKAPLAPDGAVLPSDPYVGFNELTDEINKLSPQAQQLLANLNDRVTQLRTTLDRVNELLNDRNRDNISASLSELRGMLAEDRPQIRKSLNNISAASEKIAPLLDQLHNTVDQADDTLKKVDGMVAENREDVRASVIKLRETLEHVSVLTAQLQTILDNNDYNIEQLLNNMRIVSENLKEFTDTIKTRPSTLVLPSKVHDRNPGDTQ